MLREVMYVQKARLEHAAWGIREVEHFSYRKLLKKHIAVLG